jgi:hypothetical protein
MKKLANILREDVISKYANPEFYLERTQVINELVINDILDYVVDGKYIYVVLSYENYEDLPEYKKQALINLGFYLKDVDGKVFVYECGIV